MKKQYTNSIEEFIDVLPKKNNKSVICILKNIKEYIESLSDICPEKLKKILEEKNKGNRSSFYRKFGDVDEYQKYDKVKNETKEIKSISEFVELIKNTKFNTQYKKLEIFKKIVDNIFDLEKIDSIDNVKNIFEPLEKDAPKKIVETIDVIYLFLEKEKSLFEESEIVSYYKRGIWNRLIDIILSINKLKKNKNFDTSIKNIIKEKYNEINKKYKYEIFFRAPSNIKGINKFIKYI